MHMKLPSLSDPTVSRAVHFVLDQIIKTEPPRSWSKEDKLLFMSLPAQIRAVIARREQERESGLRRKQNELEWLRLAIQLLPKELLVEDISTVQQLDDTELDALIDTLRTKHAEGKRNSNS